MDTIRCRECGSADVTEFNPGSYVCGQCETVFRQAEPSSSQETSGCQIDACGVPAVGRCRSCGRRFCRTHQAVERYASDRQLIRSRHDDWCSSCQYDATYGAAARQLALESQQVRSASSAQELLAAVTGPARYRAGGERPVDGALVRDAWRRLSGVGRLPRTDSELMRLTHNRLRKSFTRKYAVVYEITGSASCGPVWVAPNALRREAVLGGYADAVLDREGVVYEVARNGSFYPSDSGGGSFVVVTRGASLDLPGQVLFPPGGRPLNGDQVRVLDRERVVQSSTGLGGELIRADLVAAVYRGLEHHGVER
jgi:hypothetical protein